MVSEVFEFWTHQLINTTLNHTILTLKHAGYCWIPYKRVHGSVEGRSPKSKETWRELWVGQ